MRLALHQISPAVCLTLFVGSAWAQTEPKFLPAPQLVGGIPSRPFLMEPAVQQDLGLTDKQVGRLRQIEAAFLQANQRASTGQDPRTGGGFDFGNMMNNVEQTARQKQAAIGQTLTSAQKSRFHQLELQREGWLALGRPDVARQIQLSPPRFKKIQEIIGAMRQSQTNALLNPGEPGTASQFTPQALSLKNLNPGNGFQDRTGTFTPTNGPLNFATQDTKQLNQKTAESSQKVQSESLRQVEALLTPAQKTAFEEILGSPFDFQMMKRPGATPARSSPVGGASQVKARR